MKSHAPLLLLLALVGMACKDQGSPGMDLGPVEPPVEQPIDFDHASFDLNGSKHVVDLSTQWNSYQANEIVIRGGGGLSNTLMMTFRPRFEGRADINLDMTGFWDLSMCTPRNKYLLTSDTSNYIRVTAFDSGSALLKGEFSLTFKYEKDTTQVASFRNGYFEAHIDTVYTFAYCIEG